MPRGGFNLCCFITYFSLFHERPHPASFWDFNVYCSFKIHILCNELPISLNVNHHFLEMGERIFPVDIGLMAINSSIVDAYIPQNALSCEVAIVDRSIFLWLS